MPRIALLDQVVSTQDEARKRLQPDTEGSVWVRARRQSGGRGRQGRVWEALDGNLFLSCAFVWKNPPERRSLLTLVAGWALWESLIAHNATPGGLYLKWPNDLMAPEGKVGGVLVESFGSAQSPEIVAGWGVNLRKAPELPGGLRAAALPDVNNIILDAAILAHTLAERFEALLQAWRQGGQAFESQLLHDLARGPMTPFWGSSGRLADGREATALGLEADGALRVRLPGGAELPVHAGEFTVLPQLSS